MQTDSFNNIRNRQQPTQPSGGYISYEAPSVPNVDTTAQFNSYSNPTQQEIPSPMGTTSKQFEAYKAATKPKGKLKLPRWAMIALGIFVLFVVILVFYMLLAPRSQGINLAEEDRLHRAFNDKLMQQKAQAQREYEDRQRKIADQRAKNVQNPPPVVKQQPAPPVQPPKPPAAPVTTEAPKAPVQPPPVSDSQTAYVTSYDVADDDPETDQDDEEEEEEEDDEQDQGEPHDVDYNQYGLPKDPKLQKQELDRQWREQEEYNRRYDEEEDISYGKRSGPKPPKKGKILKPPKKQGILKKNRKPNKAPPKKDTRREPPKKEMPTVVVKPVETKAPVAVPKQPVPAAPVSAAPVPATPVTSGPTPAPVQQKPAAVPETAAPKPPAVPKPKPKVQPPAKKIQPKPSSKTKTNQRNAPQPQRKANTRGRNRYDDYDREFEDEVGAMYNSKGQPTRTTYKKKSIKNRGRSNPYLYNYDEEYHEEDHSDYDRDEPRRTPNKRQRKY